VIHWEWEWDPPGERLRKRRQSIHHKWHLRVLGPAKLGKQPLTRIFLYISAVVNIAIKTNIY